MPLLMLKELPRYECLLGAAERHPSLDPSATELFLHLLRTGDDVFAAESAFLSVHNITQGRFTILMLLSRPCDAVDTPAGLADKAGVTRATISGLLDTLVKDGFVERRADPNDRRTIRIVVTRRGQAFVEKLLPDYFQCVAEIIGPLKRADRKQLVGLLQKIQHGLSRRGGAKRNGTKA